MHISIEVAVVCLVYAYVCCSMLCVGQIRDCPGSALAGMWPWGLDTAMLVAAFNLQYTYINNVPYACGLYSKLYSSYSSFNTSCNSWPPAQVCFAAMVFHAAAWLLEV